MDDFRGEAVFASQFLKRESIAGGPIPKAEIVTHQNRARAELSAQNFVYEFLRSQPGDFRREGKNQDFVDALIEHQPSALLGCSEQAGRTRGSHQFGRMRIESQRRGLPAVLMGDGRYAPHDLLVTDVDTIEIADGNRARAEVARQFGEASKDPHAISPTRISRPS